MSYFLLVGETSCLHQDIMAKLFFSWGVSFSCQGDNPTSARVHPVSETSCWDHFCLSELPPVEKTFAWAPCVMPKVLGMLVWPLVVNKTSRRALFPLPMPPHLISSAWPLSLGKTFYSLRHHNISQTSPRQWDVTPREPTLAERLSFLSGRQPYFGKTPCQSLFLNEAFYCRWDSYRYVPFNLRLVGQSNFVVTTYRQYNLCQYNPFLSPKKENVMPIDAWRWIPIAVTSNKSCRYDLSCVGLQDSKHSMKQHANRGYLRW